MIKSLTKKKPLLTNAHNNRRSDHAIRSAIESIQGLLFDPQASSHIYTRLLDHITHITHSDYSVNFLPDTMSNGIIMPELKHNLHAIYNNRGIGFIHQHILNSWIRQKTLPMQATLFNDPVPTHYQRLLIAPEKVTSLLILPIVSHNKLRSICILGKASGEYSTDIIQRLMPLLGSVVCTLQSTCSVKNHILDLDKKITDNRYLNSLLSSSPAAILVVSPENKVVLGNPVAYDIFGASDEPASLLEQNIKTLIPHFKSLFQWSNQHHRYGNDDPKRVPQVWENQIARRLDGEQLAINMTVFRYTHCNQSYTTLQIQDITGMKEDTEAQQLISQQLSALTRLVPVGIIQIDALWNCVYANDKWCQFSGLTKEETTGQHWMNTVHNDDAQILQEGLQQAFQLGSDYQKDIRLISPSGQLRWVDFNTNILLNDSGHVTGFLGTFQDITEQLAIKEKLRHIAQYDSLTGLANRNLFQDRLQQAFYRSERNHESISVFFLDVDGFKDINDTLGHDIGDLLLQQVAERLLNVLRRNDTVARFGGDEFVILLGVNDDNNTTSYVASKIIDTIAQPYLVEGHEVFITISIGIASGNHTNSSPKKILKQADATLYLAKREGKNNFQLFNANLDAEAQQRVKLANQLRHAIRDQRYHLLYQPVSTINTNEVIGFESLLRFEDDNDNVIEPSQFIPILEETGMMAEAGKWVIEETCRQLRAWQLSGLFPKHGFLSFNVSPKQLLDDSIVTTITNACHLHSIEPHYLVMEITETVLISKPQKVKKILEDLKKIGLQFALDDFGTGYSSLSYLQQYPFDHIKIDRSFIKNVLTDKNDAKITKAIISLAKSLDLKITAEGVTDKDTLAFLKDSGVDHYQGYLLGRPLLPENAADQLVSSCQKQQ